MESLLKTIFRNGIHRTAYLQKICVTLVIGVICLFVYSLWEPYFSDPILIVDEAFYAETALQFLDGDYAYRDNKPPGIFLAYALIARIFGRYNHTALHICACLTVLATGILLYLILRVFTGTLTALLGFTVYVLLPVLSFSPSNFFAANTEIFLMFFICLSILIFLKSASNKTGLFFAGCACAIGFLFKPQGILTLPLLIGYHFYRISPQSRAALKRVLYDLAILCAGFIFGLAPAAVFFGVHQGFNMLFYNVFGANISYFMSDIDPVSGLIFGFKKTLNLLEYSNHWDRKVIFYVLASLQFCRFFIALFKSKSSKKTTAVFWMGWSVISFIALCAGFRFSGHYFYMVYPVIAGLCAFFWTSIIARCRELHWNSNIRRISATTGIMLLLTTTLLYPLIFYTGFPFGSKELNTYLRITGSPGETLVRTSYYINARTHPSDTLFVWGFAPELYTLSRRRCAARYIISNYLVGEVSPFLKGANRTATNPQFWDELFADLSENQPEYIIDTAPLNYLGFASHPLAAYPRLSQYVTKNYEFDKEIGKVRLYRKKQ